MTVLRAIAIVALGLSGVVLALTAHPRWRRPVLARRLAPYLGALGPRRSALLDAAASGSRLFALLDPVRRAVGDRIDRLLGEGRDLDARLEAAGSELGASAFRAEQVTWGVVGSIGGLAFGLLLVAAGRPLSPVMILVLIACFGFAGFAGRDRALARATARRRESARVALPTIVDLVCLAVTAGESLRGAIGMVAESGTGPLSEEMRRALRLARTGTPLVVALEARARMLDLPPFDRFVSAVGAAQERGVPLADALRSLAFDLREHDKRELIEVAGKKQISMLVPVIALILPVAIVFAFYPGIVAIRTLAR